ncbi:MAG TPA: hypothetical protein ENI23_16955, partial [bacterium]|nr:hypothetical protein [bacterium]
MPNIFETISQRVQSFVPQFIKPEEEPTEPEKEARKVLESAKVLGEEIREAKPLVKVAPVVPKAVFNIFEIISRVGGALQERIGMFAVPKKEREPFIPLKEETFMEAIRRQPLLGEVVQKGLEKTPIGKIPAIPIAAGFLSEFLLPPYGIKGGKPKPKAKPKPIPKELESLAQEVPKFKTAEEFANNKFVKMGISPKIKELGIEGIQKDVTAGTVGDLIFDPILRKDFADVLDVPVRIKSKHLGRTDFFGAFTPTKEGGIILHPNAIVRIGASETSEFAPSLRAILVEEMTHAKQAILNRGGDTSLPYAKRPQEITAKKSREFYDGKRPSSSQLTDFFNQVKGVEGVPIDLDLAPAKIRTEVAKSIEESAQKVLPEQNLLKAEVSQELANSRIVSSLPPSKQVSVTKSIANEFAEYKKLESGIKGAWLKIREVFQDSFIRARKLQEKVNKGAPI